MINKTMFPIFFICFTIYICSGKWNLRTAAITSMVALFTAYDRPNYQKLIVQHINDLQCSRKSLKRRIYSKHTRKARSFLMRPMKYVWIRTASSSQRDCINRVAKFLPVRAIAMKILEDKLYPKRNSKINSSTLMIHWKNYRQTLTNKWKSWTFVCRPKG